MKRVLSLKSGLRCLIIGLAISLASACAVHTESTASAATKDQKNKKSSIARSFTATLIRVIDGDSLIVRDRSGKKHRLRLAGIDAPESRQTGGQAATKKLRKILGRERLRVSSGKTDRYKRLIAHIRVGDQDVSLLMLSAGMAWFYRRFERELPLARRQIYDLAENRAKAGGRGLWANKAPTPPWEFRHRERRR